MSTFFKKKFYSLKKKSINKWFSHKNYKLQNMRKIKNFNFLNNKKIYYVLQI